MDDPLGIFIQTYHIICILLPSSDTSYIQSDRVGCRGKIIIHKNESLYVKLFYAYDYG